MILLLILFVPLLNFLILFLHGPFAKLHHNTLKKLLTQISVFNLFINVILIWFVFIELRTSDVISEVFLFNFYNSHVFAFSSIFYMLNDVILFNNPILVNYVFLFDSLTIIMLFVVLVVSLMVQLFSLEYMFQDLLIIRFFAFLNFFTLCMLVLVTAGSFIQMFIGWEGVGVASFLLIGFWFNRKQAVKCALKAIIINRIGDCSLLAAFALIGFFIGDFSYFSVFNVINESLISSEYFDFNLIHESKTTGNTGNTYFSYTSSLAWVFLRPIALPHLIAILICIGAFAKSAQFGLHSWLPDAMEGPTPVSALIHAATMVTAGVFLLIRCAPIIVLSEVALNTLVLIGSLTAFFGASVALFQFDIKKIIAYSTCSQLGYMVVSCGFALFDLSLFHLTTHAFFKASLFMCAGLIIHSLNNEQDIRRFGGLIHLMPITYFSMFLCSLCLGGFPFFSGFFSKDAIMEMAFSCNKINWLSLFLLLSAACLTVAYSIKLFYYVFWRPFFSSRSVILAIHETLFSSIAVLSLSFISIFLGYLFIAGLYINFFEISAYKYNLLYVVSEGCFNCFWEWPYNRIVGFSYITETLDFFNLIHLYLPIIIFFILISSACLAWCIFNKQFLKEDCLYFFYNNKITYYYWWCVFKRHLFIFFSKAWFIDILLTKVSRVLFFVNKAFISRFIEGGFFEFLFVLNLVSFLRNTEQFLYKNCSGRLGNYFDIVVVFFIIFILSIIILFV